MEYTNTTHHQGRQRMIIDASGTMLGRLASYAAKQVLNGNEIVIVNAEKAVISGRKQRIINDFKQRLEFRTLGSQKKAPSQYASGGPTKAKNHREKNVAGPKMLIRIFFIALGGNVLDQS